MPTPIALASIFACWQPEASATPLQPGDIARVLLHWQSDSALSAHYKITLQLLDPANQIVAQVDSEPVGGSRPTSSWQPGEVVTDPYGLPIPLGTPPGRYPLILAVYDASAGQRLTIQQVSRQVGDAMTLARITVVPPASPPPAAILPIRYRADVKLGPLHFLGHDRTKQDFGYAPDTPLTPGDLLHVTTFWQLDQEINEDWSFDLLLDDLALGRFPLAGTGLSYQPLVARIAVARRAHSGPAA